MSVESAISLALLMLIVYSVTQTNTKRRYEAIQKQLNQIHNELAAFETRQNETWERYRNIISGHKAETHLLRQSVEPLKTGLLLLEGAVRNQTDTLVKALERLGVTNAKIGHVYQYLDTIISKQQGPSNEHDT